MEVEQIVPVSRLTNYDVVNIEGEDMGQVQNFMLDIAQGRIAFVVVSFGGTLGLTDKWFAIPWEILAWSPENKNFVLDMPREVLENAPGIDKGNWPYDIDLSWLKACYSYYGCAPYWETPFVDEEHKRKLAYAIWELEGRPAGKDVEDYYQAEKILREREAKQMHPKDFAAIKPTRTAARGK
jgi:sporulation protein YlmC with PRC-barrel domain